VDVAGANPSKTLADVVAATCRTLRDAFSDK